MKAYPFQHKNPTSGLTTASEGMELRDWFAGLAMQAMLQQGSNIYHLIADRAYMVSDEMMESRKRKDVPNE